MCRLPDIHIILKHISKSSRNRGLNPRVKTSSSKVLKDVHPHPSDSSELEPRGEHQAYKVMCRYYENFFL